jgi:hypothetical protein
VCECVGEHVWAYKCVSMGVSIGMHVSTCVSVHVSTCEHV